LNNEKNYETITEYKDKNKETGVGICGEPQSYSQQGIHEDGAATNLRL